MNSTSPQDGIAHESAHVELGADDLPAYCPNPSMPLWNHHPRVFLDVLKTGSASCPYCGTEYRLKPGTVVHGH
jgi:uncharacterized Zn-finger protein